MFAQLGESPAESQLAKHGEIGLRIGMEGVQERSVPVKKDATQFLAGVHRRKSNRKSRRFSPNHPAKTATRAKARQARRGYELTERIRLIRGWKSAGDVVVAVKGKIIEAGADAIPSGHIGGFRAADMSAGGDHYIPVAQWTAHQDNVQLNLGSRLQRLRTEEKDSRGTDIASDQCYGIFFADTTNASELQGQFQTGSWTLALLGVDAHGVGRHAQESARLRRFKQRLNAQRGHWLWPRFVGEKGRPIGLKHLFRRERQIFPS